MVDANARRATHIHLSVSLRQLMRNLSIRRGVGNEGQSCRGRLRHNLHSTSRGALDTKSLRVERRVPLEHTGRYFKGGHDGRHKKDRHMLRGINLHGLFTLTHAQHTTIKARVE